MTHVYLTKYPVHLALARPQENRPKRGWALNEPQFRHRAVMALFGNLTEDNPRQANSVLFRLDVVPGQAPYFQVQSLTQPTNLWSDQIEVKKIELKAPPTGSGVRFRLTVNAVHRKGSGGVTPVQTDDRSESGTEMTDWLTAKMQRALTDIHLIDHRREVLGADRRGGKHAAFVLQVDNVEAVAAVGDQDHLTKLLLNGVGREKAYGCGLLSIQEL